MIDLSYIDPIGTSGGDAGDPYTGWDRFGRPRDMRWTKDLSTLERVLHGYDRDSPRTWRENGVAASGEDKFYQYDGLYQVTERARGNLNVNRVPRSAGCRCARKASATTRSGIGRFSRGCRVDATEFL